MKITSARSFALVVIATSLATALPMTAFAGTPKTTLRSNSPKATVLHSRSYQLAAKAYNAKLKAIDASFVGAVKVAESTFNMAMATATSSSQRITARSALRVAIANATVARDAALERLGKAPTNPDKSHKGHGGLKISHLI